jgi:hypothetical protein
MGRNEHASRREFSIHTMAGMSYPRAACKHCMKEFAASSARMDQHLKQCMEYQKAQEEKGETFTGVQTRSVNIEHFYDRISNSERDVLNEKLAGMVFGLGLPLSIVEAPLFADFVHDLRPAYRLPSRQRLSNELLESSYFKARNYVDSEVERAQSVCIVLDAWTNCRNEPVVGFTVTTPKPFFLRAIFSGETRHTADFFFQKVSDIMQSIGPNRVTAVVTDNAAAMKAMWKKAEDAYPGLVCFGCAAHSLNLLLLEVFKVDEVKQLLKVCKAVTSLFAYSSLIDAIFSRKKGELGIATGLVEPVKTRWASYLDCLQSVLANKLAIQQTILEPLPSSRIDTNLKNQLLSDATFEKIADALQLLYPVKGLVAVVEADSSSASFMFKSYFAFTDQVRASTLPWKVEVQRIIQMRWSSFYHPIFTLACCFDPADQGQCLESRIDRLDSEIEAIIEHLVPDVITKRMIFGQLMQYRARSGAFESRSIWSVADNRIVDPITWWKSSCRAPELSALAIRVLQIPLSSASIERVWSSFSFIQNDRRNRLDNDRAEKLVFVYKNLTIQ